MANENAARTTHKPSILIDTRVIYCGDNLEQLKKLPDACVDLIYIDPPFNSNSTYNVLFKEKSGRESGAQITAFGDGAWKHRQCRSGN
jgi:DNA modification methylase